MGKKENYVRGVDYEETFSDAFGNFREFLSLNWLKKSAIQNVKISKNY